MIRNPCFGLRIVILQCYFARKISDMLDTMTLPKWIDDLIFDTLGAKYKPSFSDMTNIYDSREETLNYLGTYFPRSYAEAYSIFSDYFGNYFPEWQNREEISIFDFGCGTGGEIIGLLTVLSEKFTKLKKVRIVALDGNQNALLKYEQIMGIMQENIQFQCQIENHPAAIYIDDFYDLNILNEVMNEQFDIIMSFKAICEFVTEQQFEQKNPYEHIAKFLLPKLGEDGILLLEDVTTYSHTSQEWLPKMMDKGLKVANCKIVMQNEGYNQTYTITHSHKSNDKSKVAWRMIKR